MVQHQTKQAKLKDLLHLELQKVVALLLKRELHPSAHGTTEYYPKALDTSLSTKESKLKKLFTIKEKKVRQNGTRLRVNWGWICLPYLILSTVQPKYPKLLQFISTLLRSGIKNYWVRDIRTTERSGWSKELSKTLKLRLRRIQKIKARFLRKSKIYSRQY